MNTILIGIVKAIVVIYGVTFSMLILSVLANLSIYLDNINKILNDSTSRK